MKLTTAPLKKFVNFKNTTTTKSGGVQSFLQVTRPHARLWSS